MIRKINATKMKRARNGQVIKRNFDQAPPPSISIASYSSAGMACRPARRIRNTNGVVFHASAITNAKKAVAGPANHEIGDERTPARVSKLFRIPYWSLKIQAHNTAITAVGSVQGIKRIVLK